MRNQLKTTVIFLSLLFIGFSCDDDEVLPTVQVFADFEANTNSILQDETIEFTDISQGSIGTWKWTFEGGSPATSTAQNPSVTYAEPGVYSVCLEISDGTNTDKTTKAAYITVGYDFTKGLMAYYPFNADATDQSGNGNDGVVNGATLAADRFGNANSSYSFDGINDFIQVNHSSSLEHSGNITLSAWVLVDEFNSGSCQSSRIIEKGLDSQIGSWGIYYDDNLGNNGCNDYDPTAMKFKTGYVPTSGTRKAIGGTTNIVRGFWYHVTSVYDGNRLILYVNGHEEQSLYIDEVPTNNSSPLFIGRMNSSSLPFYVNGSIDDVRIYNRALDEEEVKALMKL